MFPSFDEVFVHQKIGLEGLGLEDRGYPSHRNALFMIRPKPTDSCTKAIVDIRFVCKPEFKIRIS